jgi:hypothetical protein
MPKRIVIVFAASVAIYGTFATLRPTAGQQAATLPPTPVQPPYVYRALGVGGDASEQKEAALNAKINEELEKYSEAKDDDAKGAAKVALLMRLGELFDVRQKEREDEIKQIEARVAKLRETLKKRADKRQELVEHHLTTLIQNADGLGWGDDSGHGNVMYYRTPVMQPSSTGNFTVPRGPGGPVPFTPQAK